MEWQQLSNRLGFKIYLVGIHLTHPQCSPWACKRIYTLQEIDVEFDLLHSHFLATMIIESDVVLEENKCKTQELSVTTSSHALYLLFKLCKLWIPAPISYWPANAWEDKSDSEHGPTVPNSLLPNKGMLVNVQNFHVQAQLLEKAMIRKPTNV
jgi:hypothetical protein